MTFSLILTLLLGDAHGAERSQSVRAAFVRENPCPATGLTYGRCPGYAVDHRIPLCFYGPDAAWNMQWMTVEEHKAKTILDRKVCKWDGK